MNFGQALDALSEGAMMQRREWNERQVFIFRTVQNTVNEEFIQKFVSLPQTVKDFLENKGQPVIFPSYITKYNDAGIMEPGWRPSPGDMLADDWDYFVPLF